MMSNLPALPWRSTYRHACFTRSGSLIQEVRQKMANRSSDKGHHRSQQLQTFATQVSWSRKVSNLPRGDWKDENTALRPRLKKHFKKGFLNAKKGNEKETVEDKGLLKPTWGIVWGLWMRTWWQQPAVFVSGHFARRHRVADGERRACRCTWHLYGTRLRQYNCPQVKVHQSWWLWIVSAQTHTHTEQQTVK